jgi:hypothetical protein
MSTAAGAPPPPPPPPFPHSSSFDDLPAEILFMLYQYLGLDPFLNLALVIYPTLLRHRLVPELTPKTFGRIVSDMLVPPDTPPNALSPANRMPVEMWLQVAEDLEPANSIALVFALAPRFWRFPGRPSNELVTRLRVWSRRTKKK